MCAHEPQCQALEKEGIDMTVFQPRRLATLSVYYAMFLRKSSMKWLTKMLTRVKGSAPH